MKLKKMFRAVSGNDFIIDEESRTVEFSFSSEYPVDRWFGKEVLSHDRSAVDLTRLNGGANLLWNHDTDRVLGVVESAEIRADRRGYVKARFSENPHAEEKFKDVVNKILRNVSFGYRVNEMLHQNPGVEGQEPEFLATKWMPFEVSIVSVPADHTVGIGRADSDDEIEVPITNTGEEKKMPEIDQNKNETAIKDAEIKAGEKARAEERARIAAINVLGEKFNKTDLARQLIESGKSIDDARGAFLDVISTRQQSIQDGGQGTPEIGLTEKEKGNFSFLRAIQAMANPTNRKLQEAAKFEREVSEAGTKLRGKESQGLYVPYEILAFKRDLSKGTPSAGGYLVGTQHMPENFIEMLRKKSALSRAGVRVLNGIVGDIAIPKQSGGATAYWVGEGSAPTESQQTLGQVAMSPKTVGAYTDLSRKLAIQSSPDVEQLVKADLATVLALAVDLKGFYGTGASNEILGISQLGSGLNTKDLAGESPTYLEAIAMESLIAADDADVDGMKYVCNAVMRGALKGTVKFSSTDSLTVWEPGNKINGYDAIVSNQITDGDIFFGNFADAMLAYWSGIDLNVDTAALATSGGLRVIVLQDVDFAVRHKESFCFANDDQ